MLAYIECDRDGFAINSDTQYAIDGLSALGYDIKKVYYTDLLSDRDISYGLRNGVAVGSIRFMREIFSLLNCKVEDIDFPEELVPFQNRTILRTTLGVMRKRDPSGIWIKPVTTKLFDAFPYTTKNDLAIAEEFSDDTEVWISEQEEFVSEWRVYIHHGKIVHWANYAGRYDGVLDSIYVKDLVKHWKSQPIAAVIDVGIKKGRSGWEDCIVECSDFWAIGNYGLNAITYSQMLIDRYMEIVNQ